MRRYLPGDSSEKEETVISSPIRLGNHVPVLSQGLTMCVCMCMCVCVCVCVCDAGTGKRGEENQTLCRLAESSRMSSSSHLRSYIQPHYYWPVLSFLSQLPAPRMHCVQHLPYGAVKLTVRVMQFRGWVVAAVYESEIEPENPTR